ncbi:MAG: M1 family peptidase [Anaerolineales bacterium]|nr:M1 family peptidase [Anaerolineales bacterium]
MKNKVLMTLLIVVLLGIPVASCNSTSTPTEVLVMTPAPGAINSGDDYFPKQGNGGYDASHYTLELMVDMETNVIDGALTMEAIATQALTSFNMDFTGYEINDIHMNNKPVEFRRSGSELTITPSDPIPYDDTFTTTIQYSGSPNETLPAEENSPEDGWTHYGNGVYVASEPNGASRWYPVNDHPSDKAAYTIRITVDEPWVVAANGTSEEIIDHGVSRTYVWQMNDPIASYLVTVAIGEFTIHEDSFPSGIPIRNYYPADPPKEAIEAFDLIPDMAEFFESTFGPYPFDTYGVVLHDTSLPFALETQTLTTYGTNFVNEGVVAHELAHEWYGNSLTPAAWKDIWLNEGFANYGAMLWFEHAYGREGVDEYMRELYAELVRSAGPDDPLIGDPGPVNPFDSLVYDRGQMTLHALRAKVGDRKFFEILRQYADEYQYGNVTTDAFIELAEEVSGKKLSDLFDEWLFQTDVPDIPKFDLFAEEYSAEF